MELHTHDKTLLRDRLTHFKFLIHQYELVKANQHPRYRFVTDFYKAHGLTRQRFIKYYNRYKHSANEYDLLPAKRGPKWKTRRTLPFIEQKVIQARCLGNNRFEIFNILQPLLTSHTPKPSTIYAICKRHGMNRLTKPMKQSKQRIIKTKAGELGHIDSHYLAKGIIAGDSHRYYLVALMDAATRLTWVEVTKDLTALTVMFASLKALNILTMEYDIRFQEILSDNGSEFGQKTSKSKQKHPFERLLMEMGIKHRYIKPYRPQTNGKVERFWKTIEEDVLQGTWFESYEHLQKELTEYLYYYNHERPPMGIDGKTPAQINQNCQRIT